MLYNLQDVDLKAMSIKHFSLYYIRVLTKILLTFLNALDWVAQTSIKFKSQLNLKCKLIACPFQVILSVN